jgi:hypothetical protein
VALFVSSGFQWFALFMILQYVWTIAARNAEHRLRGSDGEARIAMGETGARRPTTEMPGYGPGTQGLAEQKQSKEGVCK